MDSKSFLLIVAEIKNVIYPAIKEKRETISNDTNILIEQKVEELNQNLNTNATQIKKTFEEKATSIKSSLEIKKDDLEKELQDKKNSLSNNLEAKTNDLKQSITNSQEIKELEQIHQEAKTQVQALNIGTISDFKKGMKLNA
jgi:DNA relaxase NicK